MDADQYFSLKYNTLQRQLLLQKYIGKSFDLIICAGKPALDFILTNRTKLFSDVPVVFCGINSIYGDVIQGYTNVTGVYETIDVEKTVDLILKNHNDIKSITVINDTSILGQKLMFHFIQASKKTPDIRWVFPHIYSKLQLDIISTSLTEKDAVILGVFSKDLSGEYIKSNELASLVTKNTSVPVYGLWDRFIKYGIVGGYLANAKEQGEQAGKIVQSILSKGKKIDDIQTITSQSNNFYVDYEVTNRFGIKIKSLPEGSVIYNEPSSFYKEHKNKIWLTTFVFIFLTAISIFLSIILLKKRLAEEKLLILTSELEERVEQRTSELSIANEVISNREKEVQRMLSNLPGVVYRCKNDEDWSMLFLSEGIESLTGYKPNQLLQNKEMSFGSIINPKDSQKVMEAVTTAVAQGTHFVVEYRIKTREGKEKWVWEEGQAVCDENNNILYLDGFITDITERKAFELEQAKLATAITQTDDLIIITDLKGHIEYANPAFSTITGYSAEEAIGKNPKMMQSGKQSAEFYKQLWKTLTTGTVWKGQFINRKKSGEEFIGEAVISPIRDQTGEISNYVAVQRDITNEVMLEQKLRQAQKLEAMGTLAGGIAHEINTPAQFVNNNLDFISSSFSDLTEFIDSCMTLFESKELPSSILEKVNQHYSDNDIEYLREEIPTALEQSIDGVDQISRIVGSMKQFAHPGDESKVPTDINDAIQNTATVCRNEWKYIAELIFDLDETIPEVQCHPSEINQVFLNMMVNAAHAIETTLSDNKVKGTITVQTKSTDSYVEISFQDDGTGIPPDIQERLFDPFFTTKDPGKGTGQGLSIAHSIITEKHDGEILLESEVGSGTKFSIRLPI